METLNPKNNSLVSSFFLFTLFMMFFLTYNEGIINNALARSSDELFLFFSVIIIALSIFTHLLKLKLPKYLFVFLIYLFYQIINYYQSPFPLQLHFVLIQSLINIKVFLVATAAIYLYSSSRFNNLLIQKTFKIFVFLFLFGMIASFVLGPTWSAWFNTPAVYRYGFLRPVGWFGSVAHNAYFLTLTFVTLFLLYSKKPNISLSTLTKKFFLFSIIDFLLAFPLTVRKGLMINLPFGYIILEKYQKYQKVLFVTVSTLFAILFLYFIKDLEIFQDTLDNFKNFTHDQHTYIRGLMVFYGYGIFLEFFPFGSGAATFGTVLSQFNTLAVYEYVNLDMDRIYYNKGQLDGVYDSGLFSMLAENGFIGIFLMFLLIYYFFKLNKAKLDTYNYMIFKIITWFALLLSITEPVWQNGLFTVMYTINLLLIYTRNNQYRIAGKWITVAHTELS